MPGETDLILRLEADGTVTGFERSWYKAGSGDWRKLEDLFESRRQEKFKPSPDFVDYTLFIDADPAAGWSQLYPIWQRAITNGGVTSLVLRVPALKEEARVTVPRRKGPPPSGLPEVRLMVRPGEGSAALDRNDRREWVEVATARKVLGRLSWENEPSNLGLASRAAAQVMMEIGEAGAAGRPSRLVLDFEGDTPARRVVLLLGALERAGAGDVELSEPRR